MSKSRIRRGRARAVAWGLRGLAVACLVSLAPATALPSQVDPVTLETVGAIVSIAKDLKDLFSNEGSVNQRLDQLEAAVRKVNARLDKIQGTLDEIRAGVAGLYPYITDSFEGNRRDMLYGSIRATFESLEGWRKSPDQYQAAIDTQLNVIKSERSTLVAANYVPNFAVVALAMRAESALYDVLATSSRRGPNAILASSAYKAYLTYFQSALDPQNANSLITRLNQAVAAKAAITADVAANVPASYAPETGPTAHYMAERGLYTGGYGEGGVTPASNGCYILRKVTGGPKEGFIVTDAVARKRYDGNNHIACAGMEFIELPPSYPAVNLEILKRWHDNYAQADRDEALLREAIKACRESLAAARKLQAAK